MDEMRRLAIDPPARSAALTLGRHLLGRIYKPDARDWSLARLLEVAEPTDAILQKTDAAGPAGDDLLLATGARTSSSGAG